jgi:signal transduction histidine kinase
MAEAMGGDISAKSEGDGKGSTFTFELPLAM